MKEADKTTDDYNLVERREKALGLLEELFGESVLKEDDIPSIEIHNSAGIKKMADEKFKTMLAEAVGGTLDENTEKFETETTRKAHDDYIKQRPVWYDKDRDVILLNEKALLPYQEKGFLRKIFEKRGKADSREGIDPYDKGLEKEIELLILRGMLLKVMETQQGYDLKYKRFRENAFLTIDRMEYGLAKMGERKVGEKDGYKEAEEMIDLKFGERLETKKGKLKIKDSNLDEVVSRVYVEELGRTFFNRGEFDEYMRYATCNEIKGSQAIISPTAVELPTLEGPILYFPNFNTVLKSIIKEESAGRDVVIKPRILTFRKFDKDLEKRWSDDILYTTRNMRSGYDQQIHMLHAQSESMNRFLIYIGVGGTLSYPFWLYLTQGPVPMIVPSVGSAMMAVMFYSFLARGPKSEETNLKYLDEAFSNFSNNIEGFDYKVDKNLEGLKGKLLSSKAKSDIELYRELKNYSKEAGIDPGYRLYKNVIETYEKNEESPEKVCKRTLSKKILSLRLLPLAVWHGLFAAGIIPESTYFGTGAMVAWLPLMLPGYEQIKAQLKAAKMARQRNDYIFAPKHVLEASCIPQMVSEKWDLYPERRAYGLTKYLLPDKVVEKFKDMIEKPYRIVVNKK